MAKRWTEKEVKFLKKNYDGSRGIAQELSNTDVLKDRNPNAIINKAHKLGISGQDNWTKKEVEKLVELYNKNDKNGELNLAEFAEEIGKLEPNVCRKARKLGLTDQERELTEDRRKEIGQNMKKWLKDNKHPKGMKGKTHSDQLKKEVSERFKKLWDDPESVFHSEEFKEKKEKVAREISEKMEELWNDSESIFNSKEYREKLSEQIKKSWKDKDSGYHSEEYRSYLSKSQSKKMKERVQKNPSSIHSNTKSGKREDLNDTFFRSKWEANYARYLNFIGVEWKFEPESFEFEEIKRGTRFYTPDFYLTEEDRWIEVKGWFSDKDKTKIKRFKKYYPDEFKKLTAVIGDKYGKQGTNARGLGISNLESYKKIKNNFGKMIDNWE